MLVTRLLLPCLILLCAACEPALESAPATDDAPAAAASAPAADSGPPKIEYLNMPGTEDLDLPFSAAVRVGHTIYLSGMIGNLPGSMELAPGGIQGQTRQTLENIKATLEHVGSSMDRVAKCTVFLADMSEWSAMNEVYVTFFETPPARSALGANGLALDGKLEIECIAVAGS